MTGWIFLAGAIVLEVSGTVALRMAALGLRRWYLVVAVCYVLAFTQLSLTLRAGIPLGVAYGIWAAVGVALTVVLSRILFREHFTAVKAAGIALIIAGVALIKLGAST